MKNVSFLLATFLLSGCGNEANLLNRDEGAANNFTGKSNGVETVCSGQIKNFLSKKEVGDFGRLQLFFDNTQVANSIKLSQQPTVSDRCREIARHFSASALLENGSKIPGGMIFEIDLPLEEGQRDLLLSGNKALARVADVFLKYVDGSLNERKGQINLRCPKPFLRSCSLKGHESNPSGRCKEHFVDFEDQVCTFKQTGLLYHFSDNQAVTLELAGEIKFTGTVAELLINGASWI